MTQIAAQVFEPDERARVAVQVLGERDAAHRAPRGQPRLVRRHAAATVLVLEQRKMRRHLARELVFGVAMRKNESIGEESFHRHT